MAAADSRGLPGGAAPFSRVDWWLAFRYLRSRRRETVVSVIAIFSLIGIALGVMTLIVVMAVMNGFRGELLGKILGVTGHVVVQSANGRPIANYQNIVDAVSGVDGVTLAMPVVQAPVFVDPDRAGILGIVRGAREADLMRLALVGGTLRSGTLDTFDDAGGSPPGRKAIIGIGMARNLGIGVGQSVNILTGSGATTTAGRSVNNVNLPVEAIFEIGMAEYDDTFIYVPLAYAQRLFLGFEADGVTPVDAATSIEVYVADPDHIDEIAGQIAFAADAAAGSDQIYVTDWRQRNITLFSTLEVERNVMFLILTLIILVAALNIVSGLIMLVKDKGRDIAILRTMGATRGAVMRVFFIAGASIGVTGTLLGFLLGVLVTDNVEALRQFFARLTGTQLFSPEFYFLYELPAKMNPNETLAAVLLALGLSFLATLYPAWRAARTDPVEALRYE